MFYKMNNDCSRSKSPFPFWMALELASANHHCIPISHPPEEIEGSVAQKLTEIEGSVSHKLTLEVWEREEEVLSRRIELKDTRRMCIQNEIYQLLEFYFVLQGFVLTALFQTLQSRNHNTCRSWWSPSAFSALVFLAALAALHYKFHEQLEIEDNLQQEKQDCGTLFNCIADLRSRGKDFDLNTIRISLHCSHPPSSKVGFTCWSYWLGDPGLLTAFLFAFSAVIFYSCWDFSKEPTRMCFNLWRSEDSVRITSSAAAVENGEKRGWDKQTVIQNQTGDTIVLRDMHRYVWRQVRLELPPQESGKISIKPPSTFFRMGAMLKLDDRHEKDLKIYIDTEQLVGRNNISICKDEKGGYYLQEQ